MISWMIIATHYCAINVTWNKKKMVKSKSEEIQERENV